MGTLRVVTAASSTEQIVNIRRQIASAMRTLGDLPVTDLSWRAQLILAEAVACLVLVQREAERGEVQS